jgi:hypothetical protein
MSRQYIAESTYAHVKLDGKVVAQTFYGNLEVRLYIPRGRMIELSI